MDNTPNIVMQCPKCRREFSLDTNYCDDCSAMLEPTEQAPITAVQPAAARKETPPVLSAASDDQLEDFRIDSLKTDIEESFVSTLLYELKRLKKRIPKKEAALSGLQKQQTDSSGHGLIQEIGRAEDDISELLKRTAKIEAILENLKKKLEADMHNLQAEISKAMQPGMFGFLTVSGRYYGMLSSEIKVKKALLNAIETRTYSRRKNLLKYLIIAGLTLIMAGILVFSWTKISDRRGSMTASLPAQGTASKVAVQAKDIYDLLEDIRKANMKKDLGLWESRYSRQYLEAGKKRDETVESWKRYDYLSLQYRVEDIQMLPEKITAMISWEMELRSKESGKTTRTAQKLLSEFVVEDHTLKIASVRKAGP